jgi:hypothetical protein
MWKKGIYVRLKAWRLLFLWMSMPRANQAKQQEYQRQAKDTRRNSLPASEMIHGILRFALIQMCSLWHS